MNSLRLLRCLADEARLGIVRSLADDEELCVSEIVERTGKERTNVSHHLAELRGCGLVQDRKRGRRVFYRLAHPDLATLVEAADLLAGHIEEADPEACIQQGCCT